MTPHGAATPDLLNAVMAVWLGKVQRHSAPGRWVVFREGDDVIVRPCGPANDPDPEVHDDRVA